MRRTWKLAELKQHIRTTKPEKNWLLSTVDSVSHSLHIYQYHKSLARKAFDAYHAEHDPNGIKMFAAAMMAGTDEELEEFEEAKLASEANLIAAINITRNTFDIFAQIANALALPQPLYIEDCTISKVRDRLPKSPLKTEITRVTKLHWFRYLAGFSNTLKHRQLISHKPSQKYKEGTGEYLGGEAEVAAFKHHSKEFKSYWVQEVLEGTVEMHNEIVTLGITLNEHCLTPAV
ncbi:hypothetical protein MO767_18815 [Pseudomonas sp. UYIF39]|uniref:hypothetical protein n=1 Tax=Pseudomonas sp. UYIF39 TaxID=1630747 RepID=UPI00249F4A04|nr:hypothetical protein [Pseudomonas sp. UYIF39]MDI3356380.1 hypothetical protein [Pseudomonas sp. UYIF39]